MHRALPAAVLAIVAAWAAAAQPGIELLPNGTMTELDPKGWPAGWPAGRNARIERDPAGNRLVAEGPGAGVSFRIPLKPEVGRLRLSMQMKVTGVAPGKESWQTGRLAMSFHNAAGERVGDWPNVFGFVGTTDWIACEREYPVPPDAVSLSFNPGNLGASGTVEFRALSLKVDRVRAMAKADAPLPEGVAGDPSSLDGAWRPSTPTRERVCLNGLWGFRPLATNDAADRVPAPGDCWGWFKVPGIWPSGPTEFAGGAQRVWLAPWLEERGGDRPFDRAWYKRRVAIPAAWAGRRVILDFTMLQTHVQAFVDGTPCGDLWYPGGGLDLTGRLKPGAAHELALLVTARPLTATRDAFMAPDRILTDKASVKLKGIPGDLFLLAMPATARLEDVHIVTSVRDGTVTFAAETSGLGAGPFRLRAEVTGCGDRPRAFESGDLAPDASGVLRFAAPWRDAKRWDTHTPQNLYAAALTLLGPDGAVVDTLTPVAFGFREFRASGRDFLLNGTPVHLRALHNTSANGAADKASAAAARELCRRMLSYGFNALIAGNYDFAPGSVGYLDGLLEACDATGMLMAFSLPHMKDFGNKLDDPAVAARYREQAAWLVRRARNHPSVVFYSLNHNATGYYGDQNPLKIDGLYEIPETAATRNAWWEKNRKQARITDAIVKGLDATRPVYHHRSGHLGDLHTVNCYLNWAPVQERSDWTTHWAAKGVKPLFFVEWGLPHISSWSSYRGPQFIWRCEAFQSLWAAEFAAQFLGDAAYLDNAAVVKALDHEEALWAAGRPFAWSTLNRPLRDLESAYTAIQALYASDNWRAHRTHGVSAMLPWDQGDFWTRVADTPAAEAPAPFANLKRPGIVPDRLLAGDQFIRDLGDPAAFVPSPVGRAFLRWNLPDCAYIGGPEDAFTSKDHLFAPGAAVRKSLVVLNDRREPQTVRWSWTLARDGRGLDDARGRVTIPAGGRAFVPVRVALPKRAGDGDTFDLKAEFVFDGGVRQSDTFALRAVAPPTAVAPALAVRLYDPPGRTAALFDRLRIPYERLDGSRAPRTDEVVVIGREALTTNGLPWLARIADGARLLVFEQRAAVLEGLLGFRVTERGSRALFPRFPHPVTRGLDAGCLRDWTGAATLVPPHLEGLPETETHDPHKTWCGFTNTVVWRCGNRGSVASVLIEKPARGDWRALVDGEFDLQYSALIETVDGRGRAVFCQLDVTGRTADDPVADRIVAGLVDYLAAAPAPAPRPVAVAGGGACADLLRDLGLAAQPAAATAPPPAGSLLVAGPGAVPPPGLAKAIEEGLDVVCFGLPGAELKAWCPVPLPTVATNTTFSRIAVPPPELDGLGNADWAWHGRLSIDALQDAGVSGNGALRVVRHGRGRVVVWQAPPWIIDEASKPYLRTSKRHAFAMASRLLANLGAGFRTPLGERFAAPVPQAWLRSFYLDVPVAGDDPYRYYRW
jgi:hypothetical protein